MITMIDMIITILYDDDNNDRYDDDYNDRYADDNNYNNRYCSLQVITRVLFVF